METLRNFFVLVNEICGDQNQPGKIAEVSEIMLAGVDRVSLLKMLEATRFFQSQIERQLDQIENR